MSRAEIEMPRHRLSVDEYYRMAEVGILGPEARVELIEGEIIDMPPMGSLHAYVVTELQGRLMATLGGVAVVRQQLPVRLGNRSEPQPDFAVVRPIGREYAHRHPRAEDVLALIEISDTTARYDRGVKVPLYARHGIREVWLIDIQTRQLHVFCGVRNGEYSNVAALDMDAQALSRSLETLPSHAVQLAGLIPGE